ncbi:short-chain oxidoreductase [Salibacterium salarium]|uniref:Short-chain oxidoreductase n=1 Tax=Salibacterium salarium TaxID=284579 RepID=A0A428N9F2_9BACI|nr:IucA/IucC family protein [Salibacterium salarium]RSL35032.1 short-chain oxidoreductase [Salibacterium salarium]
MKIKETKTISFIKSKKLAEQVAIRSLLNSYVRETSNQYFVISEEDIEERNQAQSKTFTLHLPLTGEQVEGSIIYYSTIGLHEYGQNFYTRQKNGFLVNVEIKLLIDVLLRELSLTKSKDWGDEKDEKNCHQEMRDQIKNSIDKMSLYMQNYFNNQYLLCREQFDFIRSEQSVLLGHPFHPLPKSSEGFSNDDLTLYAPEMQASFRLHYVAVRNEIFKEEWLADDNFIPSSVRGEANLKLGAAVEWFSLVPLHPWQAQYLFGKQAIQRLIEGGQLIDLGLLGENVYPTVSVRTVWVPETKCFYKLPLHIRVTNLIRENTPEHTRRTLDAAKVIYGITNEIEQDYFKILKETGYSTVRINELSEKDSFMSSFGVFYREAKALDRDEHGHCFVLASLLENFPEEKESKLIQMIRQSNQGEVPDLYNWLRHYLYISMIPMLRLLADKGISFEAHVQNSLVSIKQGFPVCFYLRDLEGMSIDRHMANEAGWLKTMIENDSPVLYTEKEAWMRMKYYFFVNHLGVLIHTLARFKQISEMYFWNIVKETLWQEKVDKGSVNYRLSMYLMDLLDNPILPAKANFISRFNGHGETPLFVNITNPMHISEV